MDYTGDIAALFQDNKIVGDHLWQGIGPWLIGLNRFEEGGDLGFYFRPLKWDAPFLNTLPPENVPSFEDGPVLEVKEVKVVPQYQLNILL